MSLSLYQTSVPVFKQMLQALREILVKADAYATAKKIEPSTLLQARLYPDMFPLIRQVQIAADFARGISARLAGIEVPANEGTEASFADLDKLLASTLVFLDSVSHAQMDGFENREIILRPGTPKEKKLLAHAYLTSYGLPQFFFHCTTSYAILRHNGLEVGKRDYMGVY
jgi:hypothetical protein